MLPHINYDVVLCASRHDTKDPRGLTVSDSIFPEVCKLVIKELDQRAYGYLLRYSQKVADNGHVDIAVLNVYVTGFSPALVSLINTRNKHFHDISMVLWHYDNQTKAYIPQSVN